MNHYVIDASVAVAWFFDDEESPLADSALSLLKNGSQVLAPAILWFELHNAILIGVKRQRIHEANAAELLVEIGSLRVRYEPAPVSGMSVFTLARKHRLTFYDAAYLELAQRERSPLATLDQALAKAAIAEGVALIGA